MNFHYPLNVLLFVRSFDYLLIVLFLQFLLTRFLHTHEVLLLGLDLLQHEILILLLLLLVVLPHSLPLFLLELLLPPFLIGLKSLPLLKLHFSLISLLLFLLILLLLPFLHYSISLKDLFHFLTLLFSLDPNLLRMLSLLFLKLQPPFFELLLSGFELFSQLLQCLLIFIPGIFEFSLFLVSFMLMLRLFLLILQVHTSYPFFLFFLHLYPLHFNSFLLFLKILLFLSDELLLFEFLLFLKSTITLLSLLLLTLLVGQLLLLLLLALKVLLLLG